MKTSTVIQFGVACMLLGVAVGCAFVPAQITAQAQSVSLEGCTDHGATINGCAQYVVEVRTERGFGRFVVYRVSGVALDTGTMTNLGAGNPALTVSDTEPAPRDTVPFTITVTE
jgi:hypothetical protein